MIINFLIKALCEKESVFVNNLGLFQKEYESAQIKDDRITPPGYKVVFDPHFDGNGFAFTMFVSQKGGMLITDATTQIDQWVEQLKNALDNNKSVSFENFGTFAKNDHGVISFVCDRIAELNVAYEGMMPVSLNGQKIITEIETEANDDSTVENDDEVVKDIEIKQDAEDENDTQVVKDTEIEQDAEDENDTQVVKDTEIEQDAEDGNDTQIEETVEAEKDVDTVKEAEKIDEDEIPGEEEAIEQEEEQEDEKEEKDDDDEIKPRKKHTWIIILIILLTLALLATAAYYFKEQLTELYNEHFVQTTEAVTEENPTESQNEITAPDTIVTDTLTQTQDSTDLFGQTDFSEGDIVDQTIANPQSQSPNNNRLPDNENFYINYENGKYYVIVGSFRSEKEIRQHIKNRQLEQYNPKVVRQPNSKNLRICIGIFDTEAAADNYGRGTGLNYWVLK